MSKEKIVRVFQQMGNLSAAAFKFVSAGMPKVGRDIFNKRIETCESCEEFNKEERMCKKCDCYIDIKAAWATEQCPLNKWEKIPLPLQDPRPKRGTPKGNAPLKEKKGCGGCR